MTAASPLATILQSATSYADLPDLGNCLATAFGCTRVRILPRSECVDSRHSRVLNSRQLQRHDAAIVFPLFRDGEAIGIVEFADPSPAATAALEAEWEQAGMMLALMLENSQLRHRLAEVQSRFEHEVPYLREAVKSQGDMRTLTGASPAMKSVRLAIQQVAQTDSTVLILGETGTGKELVAQAIHQLSGRRDRLLVKVNCAALNPNLLASELFGHEQGAFTGATRRRLGRFEMAQRGTIFLDEIAEISPATQAMLLRVLQERTLERVGGNQPISVDVRIIAATHQDLSAAVHAGSFRADLFFRLNVFPIRVPPLRERGEDIPDLVQHFIHVFNRRMNRQVVGVLPASLAMLAHYHWPGNVRELENLIERMMIVASGNLLAADARWLEPAERTAATSSASLRHVERHTILAALERAGGRIYGPAGAAAMLGLKPTTLYGKMRKHGIGKNDTPSSDEK